LILNGLVVLCPGAARVQERQSQAACTSRSIVVFHGFGSITQMEVTLQSDRIGTLGTPVDDQVWSEVISGRPAMRAAL
jgi:hypothetical protein